MLVCIPICSKSQEICFKIDSVEIYRIPWQLKSNMNIHKNEIISSDEFSFWRTQSVIREKQALQYFTEVDIDDTSKVLYSNKTSDDIDARAVIVIHFNHSLKDTIIFNVNSSYFYNSKVYGSNIKLLLWLIEYNSLENKNSDFIKEDELENLKIKYNYMINPKE